MKKLILILTAILVASPVYSAEINLEAGYVWQHRNDIRIPNPGGAFFEIEELDHGAFNHYRLDAKYSFDSKHGIRFVYAPFSISVHGPAPFDVDFNGETLIPGKTFR